MTVTIDPRFTSAISTIRRTGAKTIQVRYSDDDEPVVWFLVAHYEQDGQKAYQTAAALDPVDAALELCEQLLDGGLCTDCGRPTAFDPSLDNSAVFKLDQICWFTWRHDSETFEKGCGSGL